MYIVICLIRSFINMTSMFNILLLVSDVMHLRPTWSFVLVLLGKKIKMNHHVVQKKNHTDFENL